MVKWISLLLACGFDYSSVGLQWFGFDTVLSICLSRRDHWSDCYIVVYCLVLVHLGIGLLFNYRFLLNTLFLLFFNFTLFLYESVGLPLNKSTILYRSSHFLHPPLLLAVLSCGGVFGTNSSACHFKKIPWSTVPPIMGGGHWHPLVPGS